MVALAEMLGMLLIVNFPPPTDFSSNFSASRAAAYSTMASYSAMMGWLWALLGAPPRPREPSRGGEAQ